MLIETRTTTAHLLILCYQNFQYLKPILLFLKDTLPKTQIELLILDWNAQIGFKLFEAHMTKISLIQQSQDKSLKDLIEVIKKRAYEKSIILTNPDQSPYTLAYLCYLAGIPIRLGQSQEFAGGVLSTCITPAYDSISLTEAHLHFIKAV